jgi:hypothetical protein
MKVLHIMQNNLVLKSLNSFLILTLLVIFFFVGLPFPKQLKQIRAEDYSIEDLPEVTMHRFLHRQLKVHFYTANQAEKEFVMTQLRGVWEYEGAAYDVPAVDTAATEPVYRFLNRSSKVHFYTANPVERDFVRYELENTWHYEGIAFYVYNYGTTGANPVFRFLNKRSKVHFYTASQVEKDNVIMTLSSEWQYEGIAFFAKSGFRPPQVGANCPITIQDCVPCYVGEQYCRVEDGQTTGYKGWSCQNNNLGNIRYSSFRNSIIEAEGYEAACGERGGFMVFRDYVIGRNGLKAYIKAIRNNRHSAYLPECTNGTCNLKEFFGNYAPAADQNDPNSYANNVASWIGVDANSTSLDWIINNRLDQFVDAIQRQEGWFEL